MLLHLDIPTPVNGAGLILALLIVALVLLGALVWASRIPEPARYRCRRGHLHTDPIAAQACTDAWLTDLLREDHRA